MSIGWEVEHEMEEEMPDLLEMETCLLPILIAKLPASVTNADAQHSVAYENS
jgi:hypothetical protein